MSKASETVVYEYNADGLRVKKIATSTGTTHYTLHGKNIVHMTQGNDELHFWYDASGKPALVAFNGAKYGYLQNLQGDIVGIIDSLGNEVVKYTYDAWGKPLSTTGSLATTLGKLNPFRYRGYVFDEETGLYYLRSRYYCPGICRFINADIVLGVFYQLLSHHQFAYCENAPVTCSDVDGNSRWFQIDEKYKYRVDDGPNSRHIHIKEKGHSKEWKQKSDGSPYEPNHKSTRPGRPGKKVRDKLLKIKEQNKKNGKEGPDGPGWNWDGENENEVEDNSNTSNIDSAVQVGLEVIAIGGIGYGVYRLVRFLPSLLPPLWWTIPANAVIP